MINKIDGFDNKKTDMRLEIIYTNKYVDILESKVIFNGKNNDIIFDSFGAEVTINNI